MDDTALKIENRRLLEVFAGKGRNLIKIKRRIAELESREDKFRITDASKQQHKIWNYSSLADYIEYYNTDRLHFSLDTNNYETPMMAFRNKKATAEIRHQNPKWMEDDING